MSAPALACERAAGSQPFERAVVIDVAVDDLAAMPVAGVFAVADVCHDQQLRHRAFDRADSALHDAFVVISAGRLSSFVSGSPKRMTPPMPSA